MHSIVTGGLSGIGLATVEMLSKKNSKILVIDFKNLNKNQINNSDNCPEVSKSVTMQDVAQVVTKNILQDTMSEAMQANAQSATQTAWQDGVQDATPKSTQASAKTTVQNTTQAVILEISKQTITFDTFDVEIFLLNADISLSSTWLYVEKFINEEFQGKLDVLINNAGIHGLIQDGKKINSKQNPEEMSEITFDTIIQNNLKSVFLGCKTGIKFMKQNSGVIINIGSRSGISGSPEIASYGASKAGIDNYSKSVALYCASKNYDIRCICIAPALIDTDMLNPIVGEKNNSHREQNLKNLIQTIPLKKIGKPHDVANLISFLISKEAAYITGTTIVIDGGILAGTINSPKSIN